MPTSQEFQRLYTQLNDQQRQAVDAIDGPVIVIAGPGTGKTQVLTLRIANILLKTDTPPEAILALTFTESGVMSMRRRLAQIIGPAAYRTVIATFHGYCNDIIRSHPDGFPHIIGATPVSDIDQIALMETVIRDAPDITILRPFGDPLFYVRPALSAIGKLKQEGVTPERFAMLVTQEQEAFERTPDRYHEKGAHKGKMRGVYRDLERTIAKNRELATLYAAYQATLRDRKQYDYSDMIMEVLGALQTDDDLRLMLQERAQYILVDEHQDTNNAQNRILELLASYHEHPNLFVVGDERQAIFRFQGASLENFRYLQNLYPDTKLITLAHNYRSTPSIISAATSFMTGHGTLVAHTTLPDRVATLYAFDAPESERYAIARDIQRRIADGTAPEEIAVLYRENQEAFPLARMFAKVGVPYAIESDQSVLDDDDVKKLLALVRAVCHFGDAQALLTALHADFLGVGPLDIYKLSYAAHRYRMNVADIMRSPDTCSQEGIDASCLGDLYRKLASWSIRAHNMPAAEVFEDIVRESGFLASLVAHPLAFEKLSKLHALYDQLRTLVLMRREVSLAQFLEHLDTIREHDVLIKTARPSAVPGRVRLMTAHKAKGLEFDAVYVMGLVDGRWGNRRTIEHLKLPGAVFALTDTVRHALKEAENDDERNLLYVALTRARQDLVLSYATRDGDGRERLPSQFLQEMDPAFLHTGDTAHFTSDLRHDAEVIFSRPMVMTPSISDKRFLNELFRSRGLSATSLNNYLTCPWRYFYMNLVRIPEAPNRHLMYGIAAHEALHAFFDRWAHGKDPGVKFLVHQFEQNLLHQPLDARDGRDIRAQGRRALTGYYREHHQTWPRTILNELVVDGITLEPDIRLSGKIDKVELVDGGRAHVVDYKTGKPRTRGHIAGTTASSDGGYKRQLVFYKLLLDRFDGGKYRAETGEISFVEPDEKGRYHHEAFPLTAAETTELEQLIVHVAGEITDLAFWDRTCGEWDCPYCALRAMMKPS